MNVVCRNAAIALCGSLSLIAAVGAQPTAKATPFATCDEAQAIGAAPIEAGQDGYLPQLDTDGDGVACEGGALGSPVTVGTLVQVVIHKSYKTVGDGTCVGIGQLEPIQPGSQVILSAGSFRASMPGLAMANFTHADMRDGLCFVQYRVTDAPLMPAFGLRFIAPDGHPSGVYGPTTTRPITIPGNPFIKQALRVDMEFAP